MTTKNLVTKNKNIDFNMAAILENGCQLKTFVKCKTRDEL